MNKQQSSTKIDSNDTPARSNHYIESCIYISISGVVLFLKKVLLERFFHQTINLWLINVTTVKYLDLFLLNIESETYYDES